MKRFVVFCLSVVFVFAAFSFAGCQNSAGALKIALDLEDEGRYDELFKYFTEKTGTKVSATYGQDISKLIGTANEPDIIKTSTVDILGMKESFLPLNNYIEKSGMDTGDYIDSLIQALTIEGKVYALPTSINTSLLYYNKDMFDGSAEEIRAVLGLSENESVYPNDTWTWEDFRKAGIALTKKEGDTYTQFGCETQIKWWGEWLVYVNQAGGSFYEDGSDNKVCALDSPEAREATEFFVKKSMGDETEKFAPNAVEAEGGFSFLSQKAAMILGGHTGDWYSYDALGLNWDIAVLPTPVDNPDARGGEISADAFGISVRSKKTDDAFEFLKLWAGEEGALKMYTNNKIGALKNMRELIASLPEKDQNGRDMDAFFSAVDKAVTLPAEQDFSKVCREIALSELYKLLITGRGSETDVSAVLARIKTNVDNYYKNLAV